MVSCAGRSQGLLAHEPHSSSQRPATLRRLDAEFDLDVYRAVEMTDGNSSDGSLNYTTVLGDIRCLFR